ncbi:hypothetical protein [Natronorubrum thiooxidans]|uniref:Uncharacterized protein n=1 Tax=Natronorubrum thiooxidans TaxID=308853 RepID=A0A1N7G060_9EURY|nr:hypothetical protein [Natronorubrum thiooxidans]SIS05961.1 hypothetical protein SAMN05421752_10967 [Natronorubrum thiooxidans]
MLPHIREPAGDESDGLEGMHSLEPNAIVLPTSPVELANPV